MSKLFDRLAHLAADALKSLGHERVARGHQPGGWKESLCAAAGSLRGAAAPSEGTGPSAAPPSTGTPPPAPSVAPQAVGLTPPPAAADRAAVVRYKYLLQTAPLRDLERIHADAFAGLTPAQRAQLHDALSRELPHGHRPHTASPAELARTATWVERRTPGLLATLLARIPRSTTRAQSTGIAAAAGGMLVAVAGGAIASIAAIPLLTAAVSAGVNFDFLAAEVDVPGLADGINDLSAEVAQIGSGLVAAPLDQVSGVVEQFAERGEQILPLDISNLGEMFGR